MKISKTELKKLIKEVTQQVVGEEEQPAEEEPAADLREDGDVRARYGDHIP